MKPQHTTLTREQWQKQNKHWVDKFIFELRMRDVPGSEVEQQVVTVYSHCTDSGETPEDAFGDPVEYARSLELGHEGRVSELLAEGVPFFIILALYLLISNATHSLEAGESFKANDIMVFSWGAVIVIALLVTTFMRQVMRQVRWFVIAFVLVGVLVGVSSFSRNWNRPVVFESDPLILIGIEGLAMVIVAVTMSIVKIFDPNNKEPADVAIQYPMEKEVISRKRVRSYKLVSVLVYWIIPLLTLIDFILTIFVFKG